MRQGHNVFIDEVELVLKQTFAGFLASAISAISADEIESTSAKIIGQLTEPPEFALGQAAVPCHSLAKALRKPPPKIAEDLALLINAGKYRYIARVEAKNGYLNFHCAMNAYGAWLMGEIRGDQFLPPKTSGPHEKIVVEYSQPNTHKALHIGHLRNMVFGESVCKLLNFAGHQVVRATYPGDLGAHIAKALWYIQANKLTPPSSGQADWLGKIYCESDDFIKAREGTPEGDQIRTEIGDVLRALQSQHGPVYELYLTTREWSLAQMRDVYDWIGIHFDAWFYESECDEPSRDLVLKLFEEGKLVRSEGAIGMDLSAYGLGFALFLKKDGNGLYLTKDLELIRLKFTDPTVTSSIVVVDARQKLHFQQLFKTAELIGYPQAAKSVHLSYETVTTETGEPFSSRKLNGMGLSDVRRAMEKKVITDYLENYRGEWTDAEIQQTANDIALGALKYGFLHVDSSTVVRFVLDEWLKLDGDTGPYLQYVHARCQSVLEKLGRAPAGQLNVVLDTEFERELVYFLGRFDRVALSAAAHYKPATVAGYLFDLCKLFNRFYKECPIKTSEGDQRLTRLALVESTASILKSGLGLLGIVAPQRM